MSFKQRMSYSPVSSGPLSTSHSHSPSLPLNDVLSDIDHSLKRARDQWQPSSDIPLVDLPSTQNASIVDEDSNSFETPIISPPAPRRGLFSRLYLKWKALDPKLIFAPTPPSSIKRYLLPTDSTTQSAFPTNAASNAKYSPASFFPIVLFHQFSFFFNLYFLAVAASQAVPALRIGYLSSYIVPLAFVLLVTLFKEALDDITRRRRDKATNSEIYSLVTRAGISTEISAASLQPGNLIWIPKNHRVPADCILLHTTDVEAPGEAFLKTDQLDGETDWKLRLACAPTQSLSLESIFHDVSLTVDSPHKSIHSFAGTLDLAGASFPLTVDNTLWANTVLASDSVLALVIYTGIDTRQALNTSTPLAKTGLLELEVNRLAKILCGVVLVLSIGLVAARSWPPKRTWPIDAVRFLVLFSSIVPVSLRVNLDLAKSVYAYQIEHDPEIPDTLVRTSTIPEDLGRVEYLLTDKTGTLTQNDMVMRRIHVGTASFSSDLDAVADHVRALISVLDSPTRRDLTARVCTLVLILALCHNVTPISDDTENGGVAYQAASPDEVAIVHFTAAVGLQLVRRDRKLIVLFHTASNTHLTFNLLYTFPFSSDTKRMAVVVESAWGTWFLQKGADTVMAQIVGPSDWLQEETGNMAREGLRTLVVGRRKLEPELLAAFVSAYNQASLLMANRDAEMQATVLSMLESKLELFGVTGVEDKLQDNVPTTLELLRNAGIKIWMLTGDKVETAKCIAISARLVYRGQYVHQVTNVRDPETAMGQIDYLRTNTGACLLVDGESLALYMAYYPREFFQIALALPAVIACRCSPQQKADVALAIREYTGKRVACIGDGGNDVSMIQCADVGIGIVGREGRQALLAADFSVTQFCHLQQLLMWHGRNAYKRLANLAQFVIHRGLLISVAQAVFLMLSHFEPLALYQGWLMVGYSTIYTMAPVFSLTLDCDIEERLTRVYPELYRELTEGKALLLKTFFMWVAILTWQGASIQVLAQVLCLLRPAAFKTMVALSFSCLIYNELVMVGMSVHTWCFAMVASIALTLVFYICSVPLLREYFDVTYFFSFKYAWQCLLVLSISLFPVWLSKYITRRLRPPSYAKVQQD